jgi:hypothetical protein
MLGKNGGVKGYMYVCKHVFTLALEEDVSEVLRMRIEFVIN